MLASESTVWVAVLMADCQSSPLAPFAIWTWDRDTFPKIASDFCTALELEDMMSSNE